MKSVPKSRQRNTVPKPRGISKPIPQGAALVLDKAMRVAAMVPTLEALASIEDASDSSHSDARDAATAVEHLLNTICMEIAPILMKHAGKGGDHA